MELIERAVLLRCQLLERDTATYHLSRAREAIAEALIALDTIEKAME